MIPAYRFVARSSDRENWLEARKGGVTATEVAKAATPAGFVEAVDARMFPMEQPDNVYMQFGRESEPEIMRHAHSEHGILPNDWLIAAEHNPQHMATPDGLSVTHMEIAEVKTGGKPIKSVPRAHRDQVQWQLHTTGANQCLYLFNLRVPDDAGGFYLGYMEPQTFWIERDDERISFLIDTANHLMEVTNDF